MKRRAALMLAAGAMLLGSARPAEVEMRRAAAARAEAERSRAEAERLRGESAALVSGIEAAEMRIGAAEARLARLREAEASAQRRLAERQAPLLRLTAAMQAAARRPAALALVEPRSTADYARLRAMMNAAAPVMRARTAAYRAELNKAQALSAQARQLAGRVAAERNGLRQRLAALARLERGADARADDLLAQAIEADGRALTIGEQARDLESQAAQRRSAAQVAASLAGLPSPPTRPGGAGHSAPSYRLPVAGEVVTGTGALSASGIHARGMTLRVAEGRPAVASRGGRVVHAGRFRSYGEVVIIDHGGGWTSTITGLAALAVRAGETVRAGQVVGRTGAGLVNLELRKDGRARAIAPLLDYG